MLKSYIENAIDESFPSTSLNTSFIIRLLKPQAFGVSLCARRSNSPTALFL